MNSPALAPPPPETERPEVSAPVRKPRTRPVISLPRIQRTRIARWPLVLSLVLHALGVVFLLTFLQLGPSDVALLTDTTTQRIDFIELDWPVGVPAEGVAGAGPVSAPAAGGQPTTGIAPAGATPGPISFPTTVPVGIPSAGAGAPTPSPGAAQGAGTPGGAGAAPAGSLRGGAGFRDPRLYVSPETEALKRTDTRSDQQRYVDHLRERINASNDSFGIANRGPDTDWTVTDGEGRRWGLSEEGLHLGPLTIPSALVPRPTPTGSNEKIGEAREEERRRDEIRRQEEERERREAREEAARAARERADAARAGGSAPRN